MSVELLGYSIDDYSFDEAVLKAKELIDGDKVSQVITINPEMFQTADSDSYFANIVREAEMVIPDGVGIKIGLKLTGKNVARIPGIDFAKKLLKEAALSNIPVAIIGSKEEVITKAIVIDDRFCSMGYDAKINILDIDDKELTEDLVSEKVD